MPTTDIELPRKESDVTSDVPLKEQIHVDETRKRFPIFLTACAFFAITQIFFQIASNKLLGLESANYAYVQHEIPNSGVKAKVLCLGDSLVKLGISPLVLEKTLDCPSANLAVIGSRPMATYCILKRILESGGKPDAVLVDFEPGILFADPRKAAHESAEFFNFSDCLDSAVTMKDFDYTSSLLASIAVPSYRLKFAISDWLVGKLHLGKKWDHKGVEKYVRNWDVNKGQSLEPAKEDPLPRDLAAAKAMKNAWLTVFKERSPWVCNPFSQIYMDKFFELAHSKSIRVYWLVTPMHPAAQVISEELKIDRDYDRLARSFQSHYPNLTIVDGRRASYDGSKFIDAAHFHRLGAPAYTADVAKVVRDNPKQNWITLSQTGSIFNADSLEDVEQSFQRLKKSKIPLSGGD